MKGYPYYKASGDRWINLIPCHWKVSRLKYVADAQPSNIDKKSVDGQTAVRLCNYVDVYKNEFITDDLSFMEATATADQIQRFELREGDVLITKDSEDPNDIAIPAVVVCDLLGVVCGYHLTLIRSHAEFLNGFYLHRLFQSYSFNQQFTVKANGVTRYGLPAAAITEAVICVPPIEEQAAISLFLKKKTFTIDETIRKKQCLVELLQEERAALINQAVTKGLDREAPMKDSGVEWLGEIPEHWEVKKLKYVCHMQSGESITSEQIQPEGMYPVYGGNGRRGYADRYTHEGFYPLIGRQGALCGNIQYGNGCFFASEHAVVVTPRGNTTAIWLGELLRTMNLNQYSMSAAQPGLSVEILKQLRIPVPTKDEQENIAAFIEAQTTSIDKTINSIHREITLLQEYGKSLTNEVVTGKICVLSEEKLEKLTKDQELVS
jgi:type I restriction enzyme, S subunit